nr:unnamed protein product [Callosobruchus analis]
MSFFSTKEISSTSGNLHIITKTDLQTFNLTMALRMSSSLGLRLLQEPSIGFLAPVANAANTQIVRHRRTKHWNPKWKLFRRLKVLKVDLPDYNENLDDLSEEEMRERLKKQGLLPPRPWNERQYFIHATGSVFEPYVPPEDSKMMEERKRAPNFTINEKTLLLNLIHQLKDVIENKKTNSKTWREKDEAWEKITEMFNAQSPEIYPRSKEALKKYYDNIKKNVRKEVADEKREMFKTGEEQSNMFQILLRS